jgi:hypothetical protein
MILPRQRARLARRGVTFCEAVQARAAADCPAHDLWLKCAAEALAEGLARALENAEARSARALAAPPGPEG